MASKLDQQSRKGNKHAVNRHRSERKFNRHLSSLKDRMSPKAKKFRSEKDAQKVTRLYLGNKNK